MKEALKENPAPIRKKITDLQLYCLAQHMRAFYYSAIGNMADNNTKTVLESACSNCERCSDCVKCVDNKNYFNTFSDALTQLSQATGLQISQVFRPRAIEEHD